MDYRLSDDTWDNKEYEAASGVLSSNMFTMGEKVKAFEQDFSAHFRTKYAVMVNSGSSANLLLIAALVYSGRIKPGDEVIVPAVSWSTTYFPLSQFGLKLKFIDIDRDTLNIDLEKLKNAVSGKTKLVFLVNLLGNPNYFDEIREICSNVIIIEDNCESMGAEYCGLKAGTLGLAGTFSTFYSHHICTMEGGVVVTNDEELYHYMLCIRAHGWTRNLSKDSPIYKKSDDAFYENFNFIVPGFNLRPLEIEAAIGIEQIRKLDGIITQRRKNAEYFLSRIQELPEMRTQMEIEKSSWFGFAMIMLKPGIRNEFVKHLSESSIEVRPIVTGNFTKSAAIKFINYEVSDNLGNADDLHDNGFFIGNHSKNNFSEIDYFIDVAKTFFRRGNDL